MKKLPSIKYEIIGRYRPQLMGIAMLNVLILHSLSWLDFNPSNIILKGLSILGGLLFTEGFLFLSGFGLYYSLHKNDNLKGFYKKRFQRLLFPYWLMTLPFFVAWMIIGRYGLLGLVLRVSTLEFWAHGNYAGMWYISISVLLYFCFPLIYKFLAKPGIWRVIVLLLLIVSIITGVYFLFPHYYEMTSLGIVKIPFFVFGAWAAKQSLDNKSFKVHWIIILMLLLIATKMYPLFPWLNLQEGMVRLLGIVASCIFLLWTDKIKVLHGFFAWIGQYTLELYILHLMIMASMPTDFLNCYAKTAIAIVGAFLLCVPVHRGCNSIIKRLAH